MRVGCLAVIGCIASSTQVGCGDNLPECAGKTLDVYQFGEPQLLALQRGGEWTPLLREEPSGPISVCLDDDEEYAVVYVCVTDGKPLIREVFATVTEQSELVFGSCNPAPFEGELVTISGRVAQAGNVWLGDSSSSSGTYSRASEWAFELSARPGREHSLISSDYEGAFNVGGSLIAIRRGLTFDGDTVVDDIDLLSEGEPLVVVDAVIAGTRPDETFHTSTYLDLEFGSATVSESRDARARFVPNLQPGEEQYVDVSAFAEVTADLTASRSVELMTPALSAEFLPRLDDVVRFDSNGTSATWDELPVADYNRVSVSSISLDSHLILSATKQWVDRHQLTTLEVDPSPPGFDLAWLPTEPQFQVAFSLTDEERSTGLSRVTRNDPSLREHVTKEMRRRARR